MPRFRKKPVEIEAWKFDGTMASARSISKLDPTTISILSDQEETNITVIIDTLEGRMTANPGDWIIKGVKGEYYPCKPDIFEATYYPVESYYNLGNMK